MRLERFRELIYVQLGYVINVMRQFHTKRLALWGLRVLNEIGRVWR